MSPLPKASEPPVEVNIGSASTQSTQTFDTPNSHQITSAAHTEDITYVSSRSSNSSRRRGERSSRRYSAAEQFLADIESSMNSSSHPHLSGLMPALSGLLGDEGAAAVFLAAASAAAPAGPARPGCMPFYTSMAQVLPASIKVSVV
jgi:hypothetical protein